VIGDMELFARSIGRSRREGCGACHRGHRHQRQIDHDGLIGHILQACGFDAQVGGNIGKPVLDLSRRAAKTIYVLEVSSYQIDLSPGFVPDVAILTNLSPDHIDRHGSMAATSPSKRSCSANRCQGDVAVGVDDPDSAAVYTKMAAARGPHAIAVSVGKVLGRGIFVIDGKAVRAP
jgi:UDP-N-acetylmuramoylalanine--D-glutamate ligase